MATKVEKELAIRYDTPEAGLLAVMRECLSTSNAANHLSCNRTTLYRLLAKYKIVEIVRYLPRPKNEHGCEIKTEWHRSRDIQIETMPTTHPTIEHLKYHGSLKRARQAMQLNQHSMYQTLASQKIILLKEYRQNHRHKEAWIKRTWHKSSSVSVIQGDTRRESTLLNWLKGLQNIAKTRS